MLEEIQDRSEGAADSYLHLESFSHGLMQVWFECVNVSGCFFVALFSKTSSTGLKYQIVLKLVNSSEAMLILNQPSV